MKALPRSSADKEEVNKLKLSDHKNASKDLSFGIAKVVLFLVVFVTGVILGLSASAPVTRYITSSRRKDCFALSNCKEDYFLGMKGFVNPTNLTHCMTDDELFWRASMVPRKDAYPYNRVPKVAFMFLTKGPLPFIPLWERFFRGYEELFSIYVHAPPGYESNVTDASVFYDCHIPSQDVRWGSITLLDAEKRLLANALLDFSNEQFVLLSESCIPIYDFKTVYDYLIGSSHSFVQSYDEPSRWGRGRYSLWMYPNIKLAQWRKGSQWFEMSRALAVEIISDTKYHSLFRRYCKPTCYPDEHYLPTYINMFHGQMNANRTVTWADWSVRSPHPATYGRYDITVEFLQSLRNNGTTCSYNSKRTPVCYLFARKFSPDALEPLLNISSTVMKF